jgi:putative endonuclease
MVKKSKKDKRRAYLFGIIAEYFALLWLIFKGYRIIRRRFYCKQGEIDIIAYRGKRLVFVEVKARRKLEDCAASITHTKLQKFHKAVCYFITKNPRYANSYYQIDAILIGMDSLPRHLQSISRLY